jgi:hypothetical protein
MNENANRLNKQTAARPGGRVTGCCELTFLYLFPFCLPLCLSALLSSARTRTRVHTHLHTHLFLSPSIPYPTLPLSSPPRLWFQFQDIRLFQDLAVINFGGISLILLIR